MCGIGCADVVVVSDSVFFLGLFLIDEMFMTIIRGERINEFWE